MAKATTTQIKYLKERLQDMLYNKMNEWEKKNPEPSQYKTSDIFKMLKKGDIKLRKTPSQSDDCYGYHNRISTYFEMPGDGIESWKRSRERVKEVYKASITAIMDKFVLNGADFECALQAFDRLTIE